MAEPAASYATIGPPSQPEDVDILPSSSASSTSSDDFEESDAEREWRESINQMQLLLNMVLVPYLGKYFGRKCAYWAWTQFMEWKYPVSVEFTSKRTFRLAGAVEAAASL